ncbi:bile acid-transporting ATPase [Aureobasidium pullulans]|uniref:Bile acid-transporting ATPase n=1 Tax=Aureobasidium pullulans TaxID=5580 RepID=A0A4S9VH49_AURPU|nr:bile acid-transporting ATPase [Aureobasidium pullulans]
MSNWGQCKGPVWRSDDFTDCFQNDYLMAILPLIASAISLLYLTYQLIQTALNSKYYYAYKLVNPKHPHVWDLRIPAAQNDEDTDDDSDEFDRNEDLAIRTVRTRNTEMSVVDKPRGQIVLPIIEELAVLAEVGIHAAALATGMWNWSRVTLICSTALWSYVALLATLRLYFSTINNYSFNKLWYHTGFLYAAQWICAFLLFRSAIIHPVSRGAQALTSTHFALTTLLTLIMLTSRKGNKPVELEYEGDIEPSREPLASVLSLATFSWVDPIVWKGYKKPTELSDVWNLNARDKAEAVLLDYRQVKKTSILAWHLLKYFKRGLLIQAAWAAISGVNLFVPTLLLKVILEYVENPADTPINAAWFYVILLFVSGIVSALSGGQALWIGRKTCIRLRAIIIGEIYAKALRRKAAAAGDKVLGEQEKKSDETPAPKGSVKEAFLRKVKSFYKGKKTSEATKDVPKKEESTDQVTSGTIINLMAVDSFKVSEICAYLHFLWAETPVQFAGAIYLLYSILGYSSIAGIIMMALLLPVNLFIAKQFTKAQKKILAATDARIHTTNEVLTNIRIIKYFAWEQRFLGQVDEKRAVELKNLRNRYIIWAAAATIWGGAPMVITFLTFLVYTMVEKKDLIPSVAFTALSLFSLLRIPLDQLADMVAHVQESKVSVDRIEEYLNEPETDKYNQLQSGEFDQDGNPLIGFDNATFSWGGGTEADDFKMIDLDMRFRIGELNVIVGPTGSGKTSLLMALLGEMSKLDGHVYLPGGHSREELKADPATGLVESVAYCAQQAWLVNGTIKENIVFASPWNPRRYKNVIVACSLQRDLEILDGGDQTLVGEKGVTLSGGQKQRISLARALYCNARHVLLDDVLSAVDAHTSKWIFEKALMGPLMYNRTCILVTHSTTLCLPHAAFAAVLDNGRVSTQGSARDVIMSGKLSEDLSKVLEESEGGASTIPSRVPSGIGGDEAFGENGHANGKAVNGSADHIDHDDNALHRVVSKDVPGMNKDVDVTLPTETKATGSVSLKVIIMYFSYMGTWYYWVVTALMFALQQVSQVSTNVWIRQWANAYNNKREVSVMGVYTEPRQLTHVFSGIGSGTSCVKSGSCLWAMPSFGSSNATAQFSVQAEANEGVDVSYYLGVYGILGLIYMLITVSREGVLFYGSLVASKRIHRKLMESVTHAKFRFFDSTPLGQIMNRFSKDVEAIDQEIAPVAVGVVHCMASIITTVILISVITPRFLIAGVFISVLYFMIGAFYINSSRDLKRLESVQRSPLYQQFGETLSGMTTIRAYGDERRFIRENMHKVNTHSRPFIYLWGANRWLAFRVDVTGALVSFFTGSFVILSVGKLDAGAAGLAMTYAVTFTENVLWFVRLYSMNEQNMNAVERVKEYFEVEQEAPYTIEETKPLPDWPSQGAVEFKDYSTRYRTDFDMVLKDLSFKILPGEKVGVVGRTGAGKSSLALALFRALEAETGSIVIDDVDVSLIGLQDLRENIVMVPQDPTLFTGTIRTNLDPFGLFTDEEIYTALRRTQLIGAASAEPSRAPTPTQGAGSVRFEGLADEASTGNIDSTAALENKNIFTNLNSSVAESGSNLSQGQRQLLCLARALLKDPKVLLMDEATASIDYATDAKIQETIREIKNTTITIAHRLQTIIDYDKVLVLDKGQLIEYGNPWDLIRMEKGIFKGMCDMSGDFEILIKEAEKAHKARLLVDVDDA